TRNRVAGHPEHSTDTRHALRLETDHLIGAGQVVMDGAVLGPDSIVAANSFVKAGFKGAPRQLLAGSPASVRRDVTAGEVAWMTLNTREYQELAQRSRRAMHEVAPLKAVEANRRRLQGTTDVVAIHATTSR
ncbi:carnitine operon protein CaiE, partial [Paracoccus chinensis]